MAQLDPINCRVLLVRTRAAMWRHRPLQRYNAIGGLRTRGPLEGRNTGKRLMRVAEA